MAEVANGNGGNQTNVVDVTSDFNSPYYMMHNENPGAVLVSEKLNGENYHQWSRAMIVALSTKNKEQFVDGTLPKPSVDDPNYKIWCRCNKLVFSWLRHSLQPEIKQTILWMENAHEVLKDLKRNTIRDTYSEFRNYKKKSTCITKVILQ